MTGVAVVDFGGPQGPDELVPFLTKLLEDVLPGPGPIKAAAAPWLATRRARDVGRNYEQIGWSPLVPTHRRQVDALRAELGPDAPPLVSGMMFTAPTMDEAVAELKAAGVDRIVALPMFPHYSLATTQAAFTFFHQALARAGMERIPVRWVAGYPDHPDYIEALASTIRAGIAATPGPEDEPIHLVFTPHGLPLSWVTKRADPYPDQIRTTVRTVLRHLDWKGPSHVGWQSRVGPVRWLEPGTPAVLDTIAASGARRVCMVPVSFAADHIETLHEIDIEYREHAHQVGIPHFGRAPALGVEPAFVRCLADLVRSAIATPKRHDCVRCLLPKGEDHRRQETCPNCRFAFPAYLRGGAA
ncbi:MAG: ferrochelatase [Alphaproteobacteria bacterium]|nr:ferrochelatase [Alphaproteobacteria bacterium]MCB9696206.1 ferrochelatase [Alphaproteobacteria bacterium]